MTEDRRKDDISEEFPVGMRVLAVDGDVTYLQALENQLLSCQYNVTVTSDGKSAMRMLRENKYDLVITTAHLSDMDGFKLLELVGIETDLPVVMLHADNDREAMMKGIRHGACDCLLKPVCINELKTTWKHAFKRSIVDPKTQLNNTDDQKSIDTGTGENNEEEEEEEEEEEQSRKRKEVENEKGLYSNNNNNSNSNNNNANRKKPRLIWTWELHAKFVAAVDYLGLDKAVPKKILEIMNEKSVTRENVASHLQKYRLYKKKNNSEVNQQANMVDAMGGQDLPCLPVGSRNFPNSVPQVGGLGYMDTRSGLTLQAGYANLTKFQPGSFLSHQTLPMIQGGPKSSEFRHPEQKIFPYGNPSCQNINYPIKHFDSSPNNHMVLQRQSLDSQNLVPSIIGPEPSAITLENYQYNHTCSNVIQSQTLTSSLNDYYGSNLSQGVYPGNNFTSVSSHDISSKFPVHMDMDDIMQKEDYASKQSWDEPKFDEIHMEDFEDNSMVTPFASPVTYPAELWDAVQRSASSFLGRNTSFGSSAGTGSLDDIGYSTMKEEHNVDVNERW